jgi:hypothetical protein
VGGFIKNSGKRFLVWSIRGSIITFTETLKTKEIAAIDPVNLRKRLAVLEIT